MEALLRVCAVAASGPEAAIVSRSVGKPPSRNSLISLSATALRACRGGAPSPALAETRAS